MKKLKTKTHKATAKRFKITSTGKVVRNKQQSRNNSHLKNMRGAARRIQPDALTITAPANIKKIKKLLNQ